MSCPTQTADGEWVPNPDGAGLVRTELLEWYNETTAAGDRNRQLTQTQ